VEKHDSRHCDYDYLAVLEALEEPKLESECEDDRRAQAFVDTAMERLEEARKEMRGITERAVFRDSAKQLRQAAVGASDGVRCRPGESEVEGGKGGVWRLAN
jgi:hypothetical protein